MMLAHHLKVSLACGAAVTGATVLARARHKRALRILMYHGILPSVEGPAVFGNLFLTTAAFARQMAHVKQAFHVMALDDAVRMLETGGELPDRAVAITFDDGYRNTLTAALPILRSLGIPATVFLPAGLVGTEDLLWFDVLRVLVAKRAAEGKPVDLGIVLNGRGGSEPGAMFGECVMAIMNLASEDQERVIGELRSFSRRADCCKRYPEFALAGWEEWRGALAEGLLNVGSHGMAHENLCDMTSDGRFHVLRQSKDRLEREFSRPCRAIAYPYGAWDEHVVEAAREAGFSIGVTTDEGLSSLATDRFRLHRTMVGDRGNFPLFCARVSGVTRWLRKGAAQRPAASKAAMSLTRHAVA